MQTYTLTREDEAILNRHGALSFGAVYMIRGSIEDSVLVGLDDEARYCHRTGTRGLETVDAAIQLIEWVHADGAELHRDAVY